MRKINEIRKRLHKDYSVKRPLSFSLYQEAENFLPGGDTRTATYFKPFPHFVERGQGCYLWDVDGNKLIDFQNNYTSLIHGHAHPGIVRAVTDQIREGSAYSSPMKSQIDLAKIICSRCPSVDLVRFTNSGSEATMHAVRCARAYTGKTKIIKFEGAYHGSSDLFEASVDPELKKAGPLDSPRPVPDSKGVPADVLKHVIVSPFNNPEVIKKIIESNYNDVAALIVEPIMGSAGMIEPEIGYLELLRDLTKRYGILLIFDEIVTFRLSKGGAQEYYNIMPDLTTLGKIIGGGLPIGAFGGRGEIMEFYDPRLKKMYHSGTFNGNAVCMKAGVASLNSYGVKEINHVNRLGELFRNQCRNIFEELRLNIQILGVGSLSNIIFSKESIFEYRGVATSHEEFNSLLNLMLLNRGVFNAPRGMFCTSTVMTDNEINFAVNAIKRCLVDLMPAIAEEAPELII